MWEFRGYCRDYKTKNNSVAQLSVAHRTLRARVSGDLLKKFDEHKSYSNQNESEFIRTLIKEAIEKRELESWQEEIKDL